MIDRTLSLGETDRGTSFQSSAGVTPLRTNLRQLLLAPKDILELFNEKPIG